MNDEKISQKLIYLEFQSLLSNELLMIASAILTNASILILEEVTSLVDTITEQRIHEAMLNITEGRTSFIIAHCLSTIKDSDSIVL